MDKIKTTKSEGHAVIVRSFFGKTKYFCLTKWKELGGATLIVDERCKHDVDKYVKSIILNELAEIIKEAKKSEDHFGVVVDKYNEKVISFNEDYEEPVRNSSGVRK